MSAANLPGVQPGTKAFRWRGCTVFVSPPFAGMGWHLSISNPRRYPTWNEIRDARYEFLPDDMTFALLLPPRDEYVNVHPNCFHLHQVTTDGVPRMAAP